MTTTQRAVTEEAVAETAPTLDPTLAEVRGRAESVPTALSRNQPPPVTGDAASRARGWLERVPVWRAKAAARLAFLCQMATRPPSIAELHATHREAAAQWEAAIIRVPRHLWGAGHSAAYLIAYWALAVLFSPVGAVLALAFLATCWFWL